MPSTSGVVSRKIANTALLASEYADIRAWHDDRLRAEPLRLRPPIAVRTPYAFAS